jgi:hypothetical protein
MRPQHPMQSGNDTRLSVQSSSACRGTGCACIWAPSALNPRILSQKTNVKEQFRWCTQKLHRSGHDRGKARERFAAPSTLLDRARRVGAPAVVGLITARRWRSQMPRPQRTGTRRRTASGSRRVSPTQRARRRPAAASGSGRSRPTPPTRASGPRRSSTTPSTRCGDTRAWLGALSPSEHQPRRADCGKSGTSALSCSSGAPCALRASCRTCGAGPAPPKWRACGRALSGYQ